MKALVLKGRGKIEYIEKELPKLKAPHGALLHPILVSPCTSDVHTIWQGSPKRPNLTLGHEVVARVEEVGAEVKDFHVGEIVAVSAITPDWSQPDVEENYAHAGHNFSAHMLGNTIDGAFQELFYLPYADRNLAHIPDGLSLEDALMCVDVVQTGFTAVEEASVKPGDTVVVMGIGAIGLAAILGARLAGARTIYAVGSRPDNVHIAELLAEVPSATASDETTPCAAVACKAAQAVNLASRCTSSATAAAASSTLEEAIHARQDCTAGASSNSSVAGSSEEELRSQTSCHIEVLNYRSLHCPLPEGMHPLANSTGSAVVNYVLTKTKTKGVDKVLICGGSDLSFPQAIDMVKYGTGVVSNVMYYGAELDAQDAEVAALEAMNQREKSVLSVACEDQVHNDLYATACEEPTHGGTRDTASSRDAYATLSETPSHGGIHATPLNACIDSIQIPKFSIGRGMAGKTLKFSLSKGGRANLERVMNLVQTAGVHPSMFITKRYQGIEQIAHAIEDMKERRAIKIAVEI